MFFDDFICRLFLVSEPSLRQKIRRRGLDNHGSDEANDDDTVVDMEAASQQIQLMQIQLQFERQRREVHAERNRRLSGKSRESRALQECNATLVSRHVFLVRMKID